MWYQCVVLVLLTSAVGLFAIPDLSLEPKKLLLRLENLTENALKYREIQEHFDALSYKYSKIDGDFQLNQIVELLREKFWERKEAVRVLSESVARSLNLKSARPRECCSLRKDELLYDPRFKTEVAATLSCDKISGSADNDSFYLGADFAETSVNNLKNVPSLKWQYFGSEHGVTTIYPAWPSDDCTSYDNRFRPWYAESNVPRPQEVVIAIDLSRSMVGTTNGESLIKLAQNAATTVIESLSPKDSFAVIGFSDKVFTLPDSFSCFSKSLATATIANKKAISKSVKALRAGGDYTYFTPVLTKAFDYFDNSKKKKEDCNRVLLFISDGEPHDNCANISQLIRMRNGKLNNSVVVMTYGLGNSDFKILKEMSAVSVESYGHKEKQPFTRIQNPFNLRNQMAHYYTFFAMAGLPTTDPTWTVPYMDAWGLGVVVTATLPVHIGGRLMGVVCVDVTIDELLAESTQFKPNQLSYSFVINDAGLIINHPLLPHYIEDTAAAFLPATALERDKEFVSIFESMKTGGSGKKTFNSTRFLSNGESTKYGVKTISVMSTYFWKKIPGTSFSVCLVLPQNNVHSTLRPQGALPKGTFLYHTLDLIPPKSKCVHLHSLCTMEQTTIFLSPRTFKHTYFRKNETTETVSDLKHYLEGTFSNTTLKAGIRDVVVATQIVEKLWKDTDAALREQLVWVYLATKEGVFRLFPGAQLPDNYEPSLRPWYQRTLANPEKTVITSPFKDAVSGAHIVTISRSLLQPRNGSSKLVMAGVMAVDVLLPFFFALFKELYPQCTGHDKKCILIDEAGYVILLLDDKDSLRGVGKHIVEVESMLAKQLIDDNLMRYTSCSSLNTGQLSKSYQIFADQKRRNGTPKAEHCKEGYELIPVPSTNTFILVSRRNTDQHCQVVKCPCRKWPTPSSPSCSPAGQRNKCECPCSANNHFYNSCSNSFTSNSPPPCTPDAPDLTSVRKSKLPSNWQQCYNIAFGEVWKTPLKFKKDTDKPELTAIVVISVAIVVAVVVGVAYKLRETAKRKTSKTEPKTPIESGGISTVTHGTSMPVTATETLPASTINYCNPRTRERPPSYYATSF